MVNPLPVTGAIAKIANVESQPLHGSVRRGPDPELQPTHTAMEQKMTSITDFSKEPQAFLNKYVIVVSTGETGSEENVSSEIKSFSLSASMDNPKVMHLKFKSDSDQDAVQAYWLPWKLSTAMACDLGTEAEFFFTSEMTNCRFSIIDPSIPKVAHSRGQ